jgi:hypothetical protein
MKKATIINALNDLPAEINLDDFFEKLIVIEKIESGLEDVKKGKTLRHEKVKNRWLK